jgi:hypothetical protein
MKLTGQVIKVESGSQFVDKKERVTVKFNEADGSMYSELRFLNTEGWELDRLLVMEIHHPTLNEALAAGVARGA